MSRVCNDLVECTGQTPSIRIRNVSRDMNIKIWGKGEFLNVTGSVYDRVISHLVVSNDRVLEEKRILVYDYVGEAASLGLLDVRKDGVLFLVTSESKVSESNKSKLISKGWRVARHYRRRSFSEIRKLVETRKRLGELKALDLWDSETSVSAFEHGLAKEIIIELGCVKYFVVSVLDPSVLVGVARGLKKECGRSVKVYGVEPLNTSIVSDWFHGRELRPASRDPVLGVVYDIVPRVLMNNRDFIDGFIRVDLKNVMRVWRDLLLKENLHVGYISGLNVAGALRLVEKGKLGGRADVVTILPDNYSLYVESMFFKQHRVVSSLRT